MRTLPVHLILNQDGTYDKRPACGDWASHLCGVGCFSQFFNAVGIRLDDITVLDIDKPHELKWLLDIAGGLTGCISKTPRGYHLYFEGATVKQVSGDGWDLKHGPRSFVVSPGTVAGDQAGYRWIQQGALSPVGNLSKVFERLNTEHPRTMIDIDWSAISDPTVCGGRNNFLAQLKGWLIGIGCNDDYTALVVLAANQAMPEPLDETELMTTVLRDKDWT